MVQGGQMYDHYWRIRDAAIRHVVANDGLMGYNEARHFLSSFRGKPRPPLDKVDHERRHRHPELVFPHNMVARHKR